MMVTGGTSNKRIPQFSDAAASFDCAAATVLHMAHPWASNSGTLPSTEAKVTNAGRQHCLLLCFIMSKSCKTRRRRFTSSPYQGFICKSRMLSGKNTESVDTTTTKAGISVKTNVRFSKRKCMKYAMMSAAFTSDNTIKSTSITCTEN
jgi:hypothetical protein